MEFLELVLREGEDILIAYIGRVILFSMFKETQKGFLHLMYVSGQSNRENSCF